MSGRKPRLLVEATPPGWGRYLLDLFDDMSLARTGNIAGPEAISWSEMAAWLQLRRLRLDEWEIGVLRALDSAWLAAYYKRK